MKKTIAVITSNENDLSSVNALTRDLEKSYQQLADQYIVKVYRFDQEEILTPAVLKDFLDSPPEIVSFIHPLPLRNDNLVVLLKVLKNKKIKFLFHLYGDFLRQSAPMLRLADIIQGEQCLFFSPTKAYKKVIAPFFKKSENLKVLPFAMEEKNNTVKRTVETDEYNLIYAGRISKEKNVGHLAAVLDELEKAGVKARLHVAGAFDDFESSSIGSTSLLGENYHHCSSLFDRANVTYHGFLNPSELRELYSRMNFYISLSLYHDDDFGRAPLEALASGLPCLLTDWIGFRDIKENFKGRVFLFKTFLNGAQFTVSFDGMVEFIKAQRLDQAMQAESLYSLNETRQRIEAELGQEIASFEGFTVDFTKLSQKGALFFYNQDCHFNLERYVRIYMDSKNE